MLIDLQIILCCVFLIFCESWNFHSHAVEDLIPLGNDAASLGHKNDYPVTGSHIPDEHNSVLIF